ncbi:hypothetical protein [Segetibacter aerophilus]|uniref:His-Xaa-Ser system protein HxsD n=1 Tax=Segetibacter aerophilus TaxID=670293 RepID=A0A512B903_9BACT|nr:hypothetical protein [Segetibacter aerophilus]GEO08307.1 hypothetical protein SAE01_08030 [Segetibacter aerophilus]
MKIYFDIILGGSKEEVAIQFLFWEKWRYKIKWELKDLQEQIEADEKNGVILVSKQETFIIEVRGFSDELRDEIYKKLTPLLKDNKAESGRLSAGSLSDKIIAEARL